MSKPFFHFVAILDNDDISQFITHYLVKAKVDFCQNVSVFENEHLLLDELEKNSHDVSLLPDLLFIDVPLPLDRFQFMEKFLGLPRVVTEKVKIIILSPYPITQLIEEMIRSGLILDFFIKPIRSKDLDRIILLFEK